MDQLNAVRHAAARLGFAPEDYLSFICAHFLDTIALCPQPLRAVDEFRAMCLEVMNECPVWRQKFLNAVAARQSVAVAK